MRLYEVISLVLEAAVLFVLVVEYLYGRPDVVLRNEAKQRKRIRRTPDFESLNTGEHK